MFNFKFRNLSGYINSQKSMKKIVLLILIIVFCTTTFSQTTKSKKIAAFENFPTEANPLEVGKRLAERFMALPHSTFGTFKPTPPTMIT